MGLIAAKAVCHTCGKMWDARNAQAVGAAHAKNTGHHVTVEVTFIHGYNLPTGEEKKKQCQNVNQLQLALKN